MLDKGINGNNIGKIENNFFTPVNASGMTKGFCIFCQ